LTTAWRRQLPGGCLNLVWERPEEKLGLTLSALVELHGGCLWLENRPDAGATFWIALPTGVQNEEALSS
jgi:K+-sensing histidine kinase KdpD